MGLWFDFPQQVFKLGGNKEGAGGPQLLVLKTQEGFIVCPAQQERGLGNRVYSGGSRALELEPNMGVGGCLHFFPMWAPPWGMALSQEVP